MEWGKVKGYGFHKKGVDGQVGTIELKSIKFCTKSPENFKGSYLVRSLPPKKGATAGKAKSSYQEVITVKDTVSFNQVSPHLYGANWGVWLTFPDADKVAPLGLKVLRAGGPFVDRYNWRNGKFVFPVNTKPLSMESINEFVEYCQSVGAEPLIQINLLGYAPVGRKSEFNKII